MSIKLTDYDTKAPDGLVKQNVKKQLTQLAKQIADYQNLLHAERKRSLLVIFQGMDASGKDGSTRNVFKYCGPTGINAYSFKKPTDKEFAHDFLWRVHKVTPGEGEIMIFNRSHYEDILIQRVHKWIDEKQVNARIEAINAFEQLVTRDSNTTILKFYMHISKERQEKKLQERIDIPRKQWKHNDGDWEERKMWDDYILCYQDAINRCGAIPWHIVPCDQRWYRNFVVAEKVLATLNKMNPKPPHLED